ncbi:L,D-transpeptidase family protein [Pontibacter sp. JAM-7]|uniref:L,D-transpeptidase family protein n=1 Tax=Pontibacter sp. JAM-7 TaxID=3366581 RepID=UPI003AF904CC
MLEHKLFTLCLLSIFITTPSQAVDLANVTVAPLQPVTVITEPLPPTQPIKQQHYAMLDAIHDFEQHAQQPWPRLRLQRSLHPGDHAEAVPLLRHKLWQLGDLHHLGNNDELTLYDQALAAALRQFQARHGLESDAIVGKRTLAALNISPQQRLLQLQVNLLRQEQFTRQVGQRYVQVNIPEYRLRVIDGSDSKLEMKIIVGRKSRKTPIFSSEIDTMVVNPSWYVPKSIAFKDILPKQKTDPEYMTQHNLKVVTGWGKGIQEIPLEQVDWGNLYTSPQAPRLWEPPGETNTLGQVKFLTPNRYAVYLHDTSAKSLFNKTNRAFSSGCIRVEQPRLLADTLMQLANSWSADQLDTLFSTTDTQRIQLQQPVPLHITYWTAWVDANQQLQFRDDIYRRDQTDLIALQAEQITAQPLSN